MNHRQKLEIKVKSKHRLKVAAHKKLN